MKKVKHNKKRNTAFLFEVLVRELTKTIVENDHQRKKIVSSILQNHFGTQTDMGRELGCYGSLSEKAGFDKYTAEKMIFRAKKAYEELDKQEIFKEQSTVIKKINNDLGSQVYDNFVPNYKSYATLSQIFGYKVPVKTQVLMENQILDLLTSSPSEEPKMETVDNLVLKTFSENFNKSYVDLLPEQRDLLNEYIFSFSHSAADFRVYLGKELQRLHEKVRSSLELPEVLEDKSMIKGTKKVLEIFENLNVSQIDDNRILEILKIQKLVSEYNAD